ncbi:MAG: hypothetical protein SGJ18_00190 [Pseudomonadota bacterium]|nr:hypothetical protein [Pseudomonadota bacterium]
MKKVLGILVATLFSVITIAQLDLPGIDIVPIPEKDIAYYCESKGNAFWFDKKNLQIFVGDSLESNEGFKLSDVSYESMFCTDCIIATGSLKGNAQILTYQFIILGKRYIETRPGKIAGELRMIDGQTGKRSGESLDFQCSK